LTIEKYYFQETETFSENRRFKLLASNTQSGLE